MTNQVSRALQRAISADIRSLNCTVTVTSPDGFTCRVPLQWSDVIKELYTVEGSVLVVRNTELPVRVIAWALIHKIKEEKGVALDTIRDLADWLLKKAPSGQRENTQWAVQYVNSNWQVDDFGALAAVLFIRKYPQIIEESVQQEETYFNNSHEGVRVMVRKLGVV